MPCGVNVIRITFWLMVTLLRCYTNALSTAHQISVALGHVHHGQKHRRRNAYDMQRLRARDQHEQDL